MARALGIDVEEWYHICGLNLPTDISDAYESRIVQNTEKILEILDTMQTSATFFVLGAVADKFPELVRKIDMKGHEIASHGYLHQPVYSHTPNSFRNDLKRSIEALARIEEKWPGWLSSLITRRLRLDEFAEGLRPTPDNIKTVIELV